MEAISNDDAKTNLTKYIGGSGKADVVLNCLSPDGVNASRTRAFSIAKGKIADNNDAFSAATEQTVASLLSGE